MNALLIVLAVIYGGMAAVTAGLGFPIMRRHGITSWAGWLTLITGSLLWPLVAVEGFRLRRQR